MVLVTITGTLTDWGLAVLAAYQPQVVFTPEGPAFKGKRVLSTKPVKVTPDAIGDFTVQLEPTNDSRPYRRLTVSVEWQEPGRPGETGWRSVDVITGFQVPPQGGYIGDIAALDYDPTSAWVGVLPPLNPAISTWWLHPITGDLMEME